MSDHVTPPTLHAMPEAHCALDIVPARTDYGRDGEHMVWRLVRCPHCGSDSHTLRASFSNPLGALRRNPIYRCPDSAGWARLEIAPWNLDEPRPVAGSLVLTADGMAWQIAECPRCCEPHQAPTDGTVHAPCGALLSITPPELPEVTQALDYLTRSCIHEIRTSTLRTRLGANADATIRDLLDAGYLQPTSGAYGRPQYQVNRHQLHRRQLVHAQHHIHTHPTC
jgi:hypothetical protein